MLIAYSFNVSLSRYLGCSGKQDRYCAFQIRKRLKKCDQYYDIGKYRVLWELIRKKQYGSCNLEDKLRVS